jgi:hypothetical protein
MYKTLKTFFIPLIIILLYGCGTKEKGISELEQNLVNIAKETSEIIGVIKERESNYAEKKSSANWKQAYQTKRKEIEDLQIQLESKIKQVRFLEQLPEDGLKNKAQLYLHAAENIRMYITVTNADLTKIFTDSPPPAVDIYNRERYLTPAIAELQSLVGGTTTKVPGKQAQTAPSQQSQDKRYMLNEQGPDETGKQIRGGVNQADAWKNDLNATQNAVDSKAKEAEKKVRR